MFIWLIQSSTDTNIRFRLQPPFDPTQAPPPCPPWNSHEGMWNEQPDPNWSAGPWSSQNEPPPSWSGQFDQPPWSSQPDQPPPWGQREPPFCMQSPPHFRGPFPPHQLLPHNFARFPPHFMQDEFPLQHHFERPAYPPHRFDYPQGDFTGGETSALLFAKLLELKMTLISWKIYTASTCLIYIYFSVFLQIFHFSILNCINTRVYVWKKLRWQ